MPATRQTPADRLARLEKVLAVLLDEQEFTLQHARQMVPGESHRVISRLIRDLHSDGHLREADGNYCWACDARGFLSRDAAKAVIVVHNHPSGDPTPSREDFAVTQRLEEAGKTLGIDLLDHIVIARGGAVSIRACRTK